MVQPQEGEIFLAHYRLIEEIGRGGMGTVYRAQDTLLDRQVAVKVLADELASSLEFQDRFLREARIIARMSHPNLPQIHFVGRSEGQLFFAMEWIEGESLEALLRRGPVSVAQALGMIRQVALGLNAAHQAGIVHRDIKPSNLMVNGDGLVKILDFGIARSAAFDASATTTGAFLGTPHYCSPEQARGERADRRSDIYSVGAVLYELITGRPPFEGANTLAVLTDRLLRPPPEIPTEIMCGDELRKLLRAMLATKPEGRFQDCGGLLRAIDDAMPGQMVPASLGRRAMAVLTDLILLGTPPAVLWLSYYAITGYFPSTLLYDSLPGRIVLAALLLGWPCLYSGLLSDRLRRTIGQRLQNIRLITREGDDLSRRRALWRTVLFWAPILIAMAVQTDWPPVIEGTAQIGESVILTRNIPWLWVQLWILALAVIPLLQRRRLNLVDWISGTEIVEILHPRPAVVSSRSPEGWRHGLRQMLLHRKFLMNTVVLAVWIFLGVNLGSQVMRDLTVNTLSFARAGRMKLVESVSPGHPGWNRLLGRWEIEYLRESERVSNPEILTFHRGAFFPLLWADTRGDTLRIENNLYGARIFVQGSVLFGVEGSHTDDARKWSEELPVMDGSQAGRWDEARRKAYQGSSVHFFRALMHQRLADEGFEVLNPENFKGLYKREDGGFLLAAWPDLRVRVAGNWLQTVHLYQGSIKIASSGKPYGYVGLSGGWDLQEYIPSTVRGAYAQEQDRRWGKATADIGQVVTLR